MPRLTRRHPSYRLHKASGNAVVTLDGKDHYLGAFGTQESRDEYDRVIEQWLALRRSAARRVADAPGKGDVPDGPTCNDMSVHEVLAAFLDHAERHYRTPNGKSSGELGNFLDAFRPLKRIFGGMLAREFGPLKLKALRQSMIDSGLARTTINQRIGRIVHVFKWAAAEELIPATVHEALKKVSGLPKGRSDARESEPVKPVPDAWVDAIRPHVARQVWAMIELQRLTGMRPGEVVAMRTGDIDVSGEVWVYTPPDHKMAYRDRERKISTTRNRANLYSARPGLAQIVSGRARR